VVDTIGVAVRDAPTRQRIRALAIHGAGLALGALLVGLALALVAAAVAEFSLGASPVVQIGLIVLAVGWALSALGAPGLPFPRRRWQVPERWRFALPREVTLLFYGVLLGVGFLTDVVFPAFWMFVLLCAIGGDAATIVLAWVVYAAVRLAMTVVWLEDSPGDSLASRFLALRPVAAATNAIVLLTTSAWLLTTFKGGI
jgi:hypothetical protein